MIAGFSETPQNVTEGQSGPPPLKMKRPSIPPSLQSAGPDGSIPASLYVTAEMALKAFVPDSRRALNVANMLIRKRRMTRREIRAYFGSRDRHLMDDTLALAESLGWIERDGTSWVTTYGRAK